MKQRYGTFMTRRAGLARLALATGLVAGLALAPQAFADAPANKGPAVAQANGCLGCHSVDNKIVGPAFRDVAARYKGDAAAPAKLVAKIRAGGAGNWGTIPMPPQAQLGDDDAKAVVAWVLAGAPAQ